ncbi:MAG: hypothetical protein AAFR47_21080 [Pseudomonadota bacterium]
MADHLFPNEAIRISGAQNVAEAACAFFAAETFQRQFQDERPPLEGVAYTINREGLRVQVLVDRCSTHMIARVARDGGSHQAPDGIEVAHG